jgi:HAD superfamily hydrolase (TIGR01450 family)
MIQRLNRIRHVALDMDGTIYSGGTLFGFTRPFLGLLRSLRIGYTFLTNNSSRSAKDYLAHLRKIGIPAREHELYTSTQATIEYLHEQMPEVKRLFVLGTASMSEEVARAGFKLVGNSFGEAGRQPGLPGGEPDAVVVGFDTELVYRRLCRAAYWIKQGKHFIATHPDRVCPTDEPTVLVDCGSICSALEKATGRAPDKVLGKPDPCMLRGILHRHALAPENLAMVGDRLYTDLEMAQRADAFGVLVLTGETTAPEAATHSPAPDLVVSSLAEFGERLREARDVCGVKPAAGVRQGRLPAVAKSGMRIEK